MNSAAQANKRVFFILNPFKKFCNFIFVKLKFCGI